MHHPSGAPIHEGDILDGKYRVERVLGRGGMGVVVAARHLQLDQRVAIKFVLPEALANAEAMERFAREARAAVKLRSQHVARVIDVGAMADGAPYMVMEYLEGSDLGELLETGGVFQPREAVEYVLQACEAIAEAHANGIVHRDLKPRNLFVTTTVDGKPLVKVLDFGISKQAPTPGTNEMSLTRTATIMGSPNYMAPEQLRSAKLADARTDIWALGVLLYEALTGRVPFEAETVTQLTAMVLQDPPRPIEELRAGLPQGLTRAIARCMEKDPARRFASVVELARALEPFGVSPGHADRIASVTNLRGRGLPETPSLGRFPVTGGTSVAWGDTQLDAQKRTRGAILAVVAGILFLGVGGAGLVFGLRAIRSPASPSLDTLPTTRQIDLAQPPPTPPPVPAATTVAAPAEPPSAPSAPTSAVALPVPVPSAAPPPKSVHPRPAVSSPSPKAHASDDMPSERN